MRRIVRVLLGGNPYPNPNPNPNPTLTQQSSSAGGTGEAMSKSRAAGDSAGDVARRDAVEPRRQDSVGFPFFEPATTIYSCRRECS